MGLPFLTGFYSKDTILELVNVNFNLSSGFWLGLIAASFTAFYSFRLLLLGIIKEEKGSLLTKLLSLESSIYLNLSLILLGFLSIFVGFLSMNFFKLDSLPQINSFNKQLPLIFTIVGTLLTFILCSSNFISKIIINKNVQSIFGFLRNA
jgi:NADH-ubiquinone oxidoreductase chain 5